MGNVEERLQELIIAKYGTMLEFTRSVGLPNSTVVGMLRRGVRNANVDNVIIVCRALGISVDALAQDRIEKTEAPENDTDISAMLSQIEFLLTTGGDDVTFDGEPMDKDKRALVAHLLAYARGIAGTKGGET